MAWPIGSGSTAMTRATAVVTRASSAPAWRSASSPVSTATRIIATSATAAALDWVPMPAPSRTAKQAQTRQTGWSGRVRTVPTSGSAATMKNASVSTFATGPTTRCRSERTAVTIPQVDAATHAST